MCLPGFSPPLSGMAGKLPGGLSPGELQTRIVILTVPSEFSSYSLERRYESMYAACQVSAPGCCPLGVQFSGRHCKITVQQPTDCDHLICKGLQLAGKEVNVEPLAPLVTTLHVHDVPLFVASPKLASVLSEYGEVVGAVTFGTVKLKNGQVLATGTRYVQIK